MNRGERYLIAPRGVTQWVRNIRASGEGKLRHGRREPIRVVEFGDGEKSDVLRAYLRRWRFEVGVFFQGLGPNASEDVLRRIAPAYPVFRIVPPPAPGVMIDMLQLAGLWLYRERSVDTLHRQLRTAFAQLRVLPFDHKQRVVAIVTCLAAPMSPQRGHAAGPAHGPAE